MIKYNTPPISSCGGEVYSPLQLARTPHSSHYTAKYSHKCYCSHLRATLNDIATGQILNPQILIMITRPKAFAAEENNSDT